MKRKFIKITLVLLLIFCLTEIILRYFFGFCDTVLMREDKDYEYIALPNQTRFRFRNHILYNAFSMRSSELDTAAVKILGFGDSILNGGTMTDQDNLATEILSNSLTKSRGRKVQFLNISAGSWGPDNCYAYLKRNGDFHAEAIYLVVSSHDAYDNMDFKKIVGENESFPDKQYPSAVLELFDRYLLTRLTSSSTAWPKKQEILGINKKEKDSKFNTGFESFLKYSRANNIPLKFYLHADRDELTAGKYNEQGEEIIRFAQSNNINILKDLESDLSNSDYRDEIHLNKNGQRKMALFILRNGLK